MKYFYCVVLLLVFAACTQSEDSGDSSTEPSADEGKTKEVLDHHWVAFKANDLEETMKDYTEESMLITPNGTYRGLDEIRNNFVRAFSAFPKDSTTFSLDKSLSVNDVGYIIWKAKTPGFNLSFATDTFIIRDGKIVRQTFAGVRE